MRNLDEIQEIDSSAATPSRLGALVLASLGGACVVFAAFVLLRAPGGLKHAPADPLGDLVARSQPAGQPAVDRANEPLEVTFPGLLSDTKRPTTALEAVRAGRQSHVPDAAAADGELPLGPPTASDRLPVVPLPAQHVLHTSPDALGQRDAITVMARHVAREEGVEAPAGAPGGYQLQVSSFKTDEDAQKFAAALRRRGHKAYVEPAHVKGRGLWHRVRVGPFKHRHSAVIYRQDFEAKERMVTFIVDPPKTTVRVQPSED